jgi:hypothetical protein
MCNHIAKSKAKILKLASNDSTSKNSEYSKQNSMTFGPNIQNGLNKRSFGQCVTDEFVNLFSQNFKISQIVNSLITLQENRIFKCNITLVTFKTIKLIITILQNFLLDYTSLQELKLNSNSNLNCKLKEKKIKRQ